MVTWEEALSSAVTIRGTLHAHVYTAACVQQNMPAVYIHNYMHKTELFVALFAGVSSIS